MFVFVGHSFKKCWRLIGKSIEKPLIKGSTRYTPKAKKAILINLNLNYIENDESIKFIVNDIMNYDFVDLNMA